MSLTAAQSVDRDRLWSRLEALGAIGASGDGGVCRLALSAEDIAARALLAEWARARGYSLHVDAIANLFVRREGSDPHAPPVVTGSHLDTQPAGGRYDGAYGVLAGLEALEAFDDAGLVTCCPIEVVAWTNEEGARFAPGAMGSMVCTGALALESLMDQRDGAGTPLRVALEATLAALPSAQRRDARGPIAAYVEAHIEQGPRLEAAGQMIGVVEGIQGVRWFDVSVTGVAAHAGTTPRALRRDALQDAHCIIRALNELLFDPDDLLRFTVGRFVVHPNSRNTVPAAVDFSIDLRHPDAATLGRLGDHIADTCQRNARQCRVEVREVLRKLPAVFDARVTAVIEESARRLALPAQRMSSGAFHDAFFLNDICPAGMIFIPCAAGVSHSPAECIEADDAAAGARVLAEVLAQLASSAPLEPVQR